MLNYSRDKNEKTYRSGEGGRVARICDPGSELYYWEGAREYCEDNERNEKTENSRLK